MKTIIFAILTSLALVTSAFGAEQSPSWRLAVSGVGGEDHGILTVKEVRLFEVAAPIDVVTENVTELTKCSIFYALACRDSALTNQTGTAIPPVAIVGRTARPIDAAFDNSVGSKFRTNRAVGSSNIGYLQYTYSTEDTARYPAIMSYEITVEKAANAPTTFTLQMLKSGQWVTVDSQFNVSFEDDESKLFVVAP